MSAPTQIHARLVHAVELPPPAGLPGVTSEAGETFQIAKIRQLRLEVGAELTLDVSLSLLGKSSDPWDPRRIVTVSQLTRRGP